MPSFSERPESTFRWCQFGVSFGAVWRIMVQRAIRWCQPFHDMPRDKIAGLITVVQVERCSFTFACEDVCVVGLKRTVFIQNRPQEG
jgi:hypothetical protein